MQPVIPFIKCLSVMVLSLTEVDVLSFRSKYQQWVQEAQPFLKKFGILRDFTTVSNQFIKSKMEFTEPMANEIASRLKPAEPDFKKDVSITHEQLAMIKDCLLFCRRDSSPAWNRIAKNVFAVTADNDLAAAFVDGDDDDTGDVDSGLGDKSTERKMAAIVAKLTGRKGDPILTLNETRDFRETHEKLITQYSELRKVFVSNYKRALFKFVRTSRKPYVDVKIARKYLDSMGCNYIPKGFVGNIDEQCRLYTSAGKKISGMLIGTVVMNPKYNPKTDNTYVCSLKDNAGQALRTEDFLKSRKTHRFEVVKDFAEDVDKYRNKWLKDLNSLDSKTQAIAAMVEAIYQTQARIGGNSTNKDGEDRYGMSTLLVKQCKANGNGYEFDYVGKKGTEQHHVIHGTTPTNRKVIAIIKSMMKGKKPNDVLFTNRGSPLRGQIVNAYLKTLGVPEGVTIHKFRHLAGTKLALAILKKSPFKKSQQPTQTNVEKWIKEEMKQVGEMLHHRTGSGENQKTTGMTAINAYIAPEVLHEFFNDLGLRVPKWVPKV